MGTIYIITNDINDKVYIGQTVQSLRERWNEHKRDAKISDTHFYRAIRQYGIEHFFMEALELNVPKEQLNEREIYWISQYDSYNNGYNSTPGGNNSILSLRAIKVYQYDMDGNYLNEYCSSQEAERQTGCLHQNILKVCKGILRYCGNYIWSFEKFDKIQMNKDKRYQAIRQLDEQHNLIRVWDSAKEAARSIGVETTHISRACRQHYKCHGYYWEKEVR